jgi:hypothetical protein
MQNNALISLRSLFSCIIWEFNGVFDIEQGIHFIIILSKERFYGAGYCRPQGHGFCIV